MLKISLLLLLFAFSLIPASGQSVLKEILNRMENHQKELKSFTANIKISKFSAKSGETDEKAGNVGFAPQNIGYSLRIDFTKPVQESFSILKNQYLLYQPNSNPSPLLLNDFPIAYLGSSTDLRENTFLFFPILSTSKKKLMTNYSIKYLAQEKTDDQTPTWHLELVSKAAKPYKTFEIWVDGNGMAIQSKVTENNGDWTKISIEKIKKNGLITVANFNILLPKGTKIVKN